MPINLDVICRKTKILEDHDQSKEGDISIHITDQTIHRGQGGSQMSAHLGAYFNSLKDPL